MSGNPLDKYRDTRTSAASSAQGCGWVEIQHNLCFVDDEGQTEPAAGVRYQLQVPSGPLIQGVLDQNGFASHDSIGFGTVSLEIEPYIDNDKKIILQSIKKTMDEFIAEERKESEAIKARLKGQSAAGVTWEYAKAGGEASGNLIMDSVEFFGNLVWDVGKEAVHLTQYLNPWAAPMAFKKDAARFKQAKKELQAIADTDLSIFTMLMNDDDTQQLFMQFADDYLDAQHSLEITEGSAATTTAVILSIATAFAGSAIAAGNGAAKLTQLGQKLDDPIKRLIEVLERARAKKRIKHEGNQRVESVAEIKDNRGSAGVVPNKIPLRSQVRNLSPAEQNLVKSFGAGFTPIGVSKKDALDFILNTKTGQEQLRLARTGDSKADNATILNRVIEQVRSGTAVPVRREITFPLVKIVSEGRTSAGHGPFFTTIEQLDVARKSGRPLSDIFGLPAGSDAEKFKVFMIEPKSVATVFESTIAPSVELGGKLKTGGGLQQFLVPNRNQFKDAVEIDLIPDNL